MELNITYTTYLILNKIKNKSGEKEPLIQEVLWELKDRFNLTEVNYKSVFLVLHYLERKNYLKINYLEGKVFLTDEGKKLLEKIIEHNYKVKVKKDELLIFPYDIMLFFSLIRVRNKLICFVDNVDVKACIPDNILELIAINKILSYEQLCEYTPEIACKFPREAWEHFFDVVRLYYGEEKIPGLAQTS